MGVTMIGFGKALPKLEISNSDLEKLVQTSDEWIETRTGISTRHIAIEESSLDLASAAAASAIGDESLSGLCENLECIGHQIHGIDPQSIDLVITTTITPDSIVPSMASAIKANLHLDSAIAFDLNAACSGFIYASTVAESLMRASHADNGSIWAGNPINRALVISTERLTRLTDWQDRNTCVLFGDGAGATVLEWDEAKPGIMSTYMKNDDDDTHALTVLMSYTSPFPFDKEGVICDEEAKSSHEQANPDPKVVDYSYINSLEVSCDPAKSHIYEQHDEIDKSLIDGPDQTVYMDGQKIFKFAARSIQSAIERVLEATNTNLDDISAIISHQANRRILEYASKRLHVPFDKFQLSIANTGNTSSACVPMALADAVVEGKIKQGDKFILVAFGGGLTSGAILVQF